MRGHFTSKDWPVVHPPGSYQSTIRIVRAGESLGYLAGPDCPTALSRYEADALRILGCEHLVVTIQGLWNGRGRFTAEKGDELRLEAAITQGAATMAGLLRALGMTN